MENKNEKVKKMSYEETFKAVLNDIKATNDKERTIDGYYTIKEFIQVIPYKYRGLISVDGDDLWFGAWRIGKISNIEDIDEYLYDNSPTFDVEVVVIRTKGEPVRIKFKHGKEEDGGYGYIDFDVIVGF